MRIESLSRYRYFFQLLREEPVHLRPYSYLIILIPLLVVCFMFDWDRELLLFVMLGYFSAAVGFFTASKTQKIGPMSLTKRVNQRLVLDHLPDVVVLQNNQDQKISFVNTAFYKVLGFEEDRIMNMRFEDFIDSNFVRLFKKQKSKKLSITPLDQDDSLIQMRKQTGEKVWMELNTKSIIENETFTLYTFREVSNRVALNKATKQFARDLIQRKRNGKVIVYPSRQVS